MDRSTEDRLLSDAFDAATANAMLLADLIVMLVQRGALRDQDARELLFRSAGAIRFMPSLSLHRAGYEAVAQRLRDRLGWHPETAPLLDTPLPANDEG